MKLHWHLHYSNKTACGILVYKTSVSGEYDTAASGIIECAEDQSNVTCKSCRRVMLLDKLVAAAR